MSGSQIRRDSFYAHQFWLRVKKHKNGCWLWTRSLNAQGYADDVLRALAVVWSGHPGFDETWRP